MPPPDPKPPFDYDAYEAELATFEARLKEGNQIDIGEYQVQKIEMLLKVAELRILARIALNTEKIGEPPNP